MKFKQKGFFFSLASALKPYWSPLHKRVVGKMLGNVPILTPLLFFLREQMIGCGVTGRRSDELRLIEQVYIACTQDLGG